MKLVLGLLLLCAACAQAFVVAPQPAVVVASRATAAVSPATISMTSKDKKAKAAKRKVKSYRSAAKRFKVTSTGKLLRHYAGKAHLLRKKRPQHLAKASPALANAASPPPVCIPTGNKTARCADPSARRVRSAAAAAPRGLGGRGGAGHLPEDAARLPQEVTPAAGPMRPHHACCSLWPSPPSPACAAAVLPRDAASSHTRGIIMRCISRLRYVL